jgi:hypothetical protein
MVPKFQRWPRTRQTITQTLTFTLAHLALCAAAVFLRAASERVRFPRMGTSLQAISSAISCPTHRTGVECQRC